MKWDRTAHAAHRYPLDIREILEKKEPDIQKVIPWMSKGYPDVAFKHIWARISIEHPDWVCLDIILENF